MAKSDTVSLAVEVPEGLAPCRFEPRAAIRKADGKEVLGVVFYPSPGRDLWVSPFRETMVELALALLEASEDALPRPAKSTGSSAKAITMSELRERAAKLAAGTAAAAAPKGADDAV